MSYRRPISKSFYDHLQSHFACLHKCSHAINSFKPVLIIYFVQGAILGTVELMTEILIGPNLGEQFSAYWRRWSTFQNKDLSL